MQPGLTLIATLQGKPEKREELLAILRSFAAPTRAEEGCIEYHLHIGKDDPNQFVFYENWRSQADLDAHLKLPLLTDFFARLKELLVTDVEMRFLTMDSVYDK